MTNLNIHSTSSSTYDSSSGLYTSKKGNQYDEEQIQIFSNPDKTKINNKLYSGLSKYYDSDNSGSLDKKELVEALDDYNKAYDKSRKIGVIADLDDANAAAEILFERGKTSFSLTEMYDVARIVKSINIQNENLLPTEHPLQDTFDKTAKRPDSINFEAVGKSLNLNI